MQIGRRYHLHQEVDLRTTLNIDDAALAGAMKTARGKTKTAVMGLRRAEGRDAIRRSFEELILLEPSGIRLYLRAAELYRALREKGRTVRSTVDCIIAAIAEDAGCALLARDRDLDAILDSGLLKVGRWRSPSATR